LEQTTISGCKAVNMASSRLRMVETESKTWPEKKQAPHMFFAGLAFEAKKLRQSHENEKQGSDHTIIGSNCCFPIAR
jgi:hypothetical protein